MGHGGVSEAGQRREASPGTESVPLRLATLKVGRSGSIPPTGMWVKIAPTTISPASVPQGRSGPDRLPPRLHATRSSLAVGMPTPRDHARMLEALSTHALVLVRRDAAAAALLVTLHLPPSEQEALLTRAQVCVGTRWGLGGRGGQKLPGSRRTAPTTIGAWSIAGRDSWVVF